LWLWAVSSTEEKMNLIHNFFSFISFFCISFKQYIKISFNFSLCHPANNIGKE